VGDGYVSRIKIAENGYELYKKYFSKKGILDYAKYLLNNISLSEM
jgi:hypothetical protein